MTGKNFEIQVQDDHLQRISQVRKPILAVAELIWNALDADADRVDVILHDDKLGGIKSIEVSDNGHGMPYSDAEELFSRLAAPGSRAVTGRMRSTESYTARRDVAAFAHSLWDAWLTGTYVTSLMASCEPTASRWSRTI
jgi:hypothetical protein